jgi:chemotaxis protein histidine kinase CheA
MAVIMNDITEEEALRVKSLRADELASAIHKALLNKNSFPLFLTSFNNLKGKYLGDTSAVDLVTYKRDLHTLKGLLSQYGHSNASGDIHLLEEEAALDQAGGIVKLNELLNSSEETINKVITLVGESLLLPQNSGFDTGGIAEFFRTTLNDSLKALGKSPSIFNLELRANPVLTSDEVDKLMVATLHYARNVAAHASEAGETRVSKGKDEKIRIQFIVNKNGSSIEFIINDDGKGTTKQNDIFEQKSSETSQNADLYSGRGLGMATIKEALNKLGGDATFKSVVEVGSTLSLTFNKS